MSGNLLPDSHLPADMVYHYKGAHILIILVCRVLKTGKNGHCLYNGPAARWRMEHSGTVVYLRDIFHNVSRTAMSALQDV
jgi:hypothetical protein